jgi:hypothetical protein
MSDQDNDVLYLTFVESTCTADSPRYARLNRLPDRLRIESWKQINQNAPDLAILLKDPLLKAAMELFDADLYILASIVPCLPAEGNGLKRKP